MTTGSAKFQLQVLRAFKAGQISAEKMVRVYESCLKSLDLCDDEKKILQLTLDEHKRQVEMYKRLLDEATRPR